MIPCGKLVRLGAAGAVLACLGACGTPTRSLTLRVTQGDAPVRGAHVRLLPVNTTPAPLPVSLENLSAAAHSLGDSSITDSDGEVRLTVERDRSAWVEVQAPPFAPEVDEGPWRWWLDGGAVDLAPRGDRAWPYKVELLSG